MGHCPSISDVIRNYYSVLNAQPKNSKSANAAQRQTGATLLAIWTPAYIPMVTISGVKYKIDKWLRQFM